MSLFHLQSINSLFLPRDAMHKRPIPSCAVRPSVMFVDFVKTNVNSVFLTVGHPQHSGISKCHGNILMETPTTWASNAFGLNVL